MRRLARRAQNSLELVVLLGFLLIVFIGFFVAIQTQIREQQVLRQNALYGQLADQIEREVILASKVTDGYLRSFQLPYTLEGEPYNVSLEGRETLVIKGNYSENEYLRFLSVNVTVEGAVASDRIVPRPTDDAYELIIQKNGSGLYLRNDCTDVEACT